MATPNSARRAEVYRTIIIAALLAGLYLLVLNWSGFVREIAHFV